jgi:archaellin
MENNYFDNFIREKMQDHESPVPVGLWDKVNPANTIPTGKVVKFNALKNWGLSTLFLMAGLGSSFVVADSKRYTIGVDGENSNKTLTHNSNGQDEVFTNASLVTKSRSINTFINTESSKSVINFVKLPITQSSTNYINTVNNDNGSSSLDLNETVAKFKAANTISFLKNNQLANFKFGSKDYNKYLNDLKLSLLCPGSNPNTDWYIEPFAGPIIGFKKVSNNTATAAYLQQKDSSESMRIGYTTGVNIVKPISEHFVLKTGVWLSQINERFSYKTENEIKTTTVVTIRNIIRAPGDTLRISDTSSVQQIGYKNTIIGNHYKTLDIPVVIGYEFGKGSLKFGVNAGLIVNMKHGFEGAVYDSSLTAININKETNNIYKTNIGLGLYAGFRLAKDLNDKTQLFIEPHFRYNLSNMTTPNTSFNQKINVTGVNIGLRIKIKD